MQPKKELTYLVDYYFTKYNCKQEQSLSKKSQISQETLYIFLMRFFYKIAYFIPTTMLVSTV